MGEAIGGILAPAIGVAISPVPIIAIILILFSKRAKSNSLAFLASWVIALAAVGAVAVLLGDAADVSTSSNASKGAAAIKLALGLLLLFAAFRQWRKRPAEGEKPQMPAWMAGIEGFSALKSAGMAVLLSGLNPKNLVLTLAAALTISQAGLGTGQSMIVLVIFVVLASLTVAIPVITFIVLGEKAQHTLDGWKAWLTANNATVMSVLLLIFGIVLIGNGISGLS